MVVILQTQRNSHLDIIMHLFYLLKIWSVDVLVIVGMVRCPSTPRLTVTLVELGVISSSHQTELPGGSSRIPVNRYDVNK